MKGKFSKNVLKILLRNHKGDEAEIWHTCLGHNYLSLYMICFFFLGQKRTLVAIATSIFHRHIMGKVTDIFFCLNGGYLEFIFYRIVY